MVKIEQSNGTISITNEVFTNLAGDAATSCFGVKGMVGRSKDSGPFQLLRRESMSKGVVARLGDDGSVSSTPRSPMTAASRSSCTSRSITA